MRAAPMGQGQNANGSRFHLLLGIDWADATSGGIRLGDLWQGTGAADWPVRADKDAPLTLPPRAPHWVAATSPAASETARRGAAADRHGNLYRVDEAGTAIRVVSAGSGADAPFWPDPRSRQPRQGPFADATPPPQPPGRFGPLLVTTDHRLVAALQTPGEGDSLLAFDLVGGGDPTRHRPAAPVTIRALAAATDGGLWLLDGNSGAIFALDRRFAIRGQAEPAPVPDPFQPDAGAPPRLHPGPALATGLATTATDPVSLALLPDAGLLVLEAGPPARLLHVTAAGAIPILTLERSHRHMAVRTLDDETVEVTLAGAPGQTADRFHLVADPAAPAGWRAVRLAAIHPLRRFGGRALLVSGAHVLYDSGAEPPAFVPVLALPSAAFAPSASLETPILDSGIAGCTWDRLRLDACIPPGTAIRIEAKAAETADALTSDSSWHAQPAPYRNGDGGDRPSHHGAAGFGPAATGWAVHDSLCHGVDGRFARFRITLEGDGRVSPALHALRAWFPRFSWSERFLPAVYRPTREDADFLDRFLASFEGVATGIEDRIARADLLLDPRTTPADALPWLARWFDLAFDPLLDLVRRRLFLAHAMQAFAWRGTIAGIRAALRLAFDPAPGAHIFAMTAPPPPGGIRVIEAFRTRGRLPPLLPANDRSGSAATPFLTIDPAPELQPWTPADGAAGLVLRLARALGRDPTPEELARPLRLEGSDWGPEFARVIATALGLLPRLGPAEAERWAAFQRCRAPEAPPQPLPEGAVPGSLQPLWSAYCAEPWGPRATWARFLARRHGSIARLNGAWGTGFANLAEIPIPATYPSSAAHAADWLLFEARLAPLEAAAHRFTVLLPRDRLDPSPEAEARALALARRIVEVEKPAHTVFDVRFYWAMNRVGETVLGEGLPIGPGARAPELNPPVVLGRAHVGASFIGFGRTTAIAPAPGRETLP